MTSGRRSGLGEDFLGADAFEPVDGPGPDDSPIVEDLIFGRAGADTPRGVDRLPDDSEPVSGDRALSMEDGPGDDPVEEEHTRIGAGGDLETPGVFGAERIDAVDHVGARDPGALLQHGAGGTGTREEDDGEEASDHGANHAQESMDVSRRITKALLWVGALVVIGVLAFALFEPIQVLPRMRLAPGFSLTAADGSRFTSDETRGSVTLYTFLPADCGEVCTETLATMSRVGETVRRDVAFGSAGFRLVTVVLDGDLDDLERLSAGSSGDVEWAWVTADAETLGTVVGEGFEVYFERAPDGTLAFDRVFTIVDDKGVIRGEYRYVTLSSDSERLTRHLTLLGEEMTNSGGAAGIAYEAAHLFLCYP